MTSKPTQWWKVGLGTTAVVAGFVVAHLIDKPVYDLLRSWGRIEEEDWLRMFRVFGFAPTWLLGAAALALHDSARAKARGWMWAMHRAILVSGSMVITAGLSELLKILVRRERPLLHDGEYFFRPWGERFFDGSGLGFPSSHTAVAFGAVWMLWILFPRARAVWIVMGIGCATTRVLSTAHFVSDAYASAVLGYLVARALWWWHITHQPTDTKNS
jgi:membrane-associated phospholipid phosphatase